MVQIAGTVTAGAWVASRHNAATGRNQAAPREASQTKEDARGGRSSPSVTNGETVPMGKAEGFDRATTGKAKSATAMAIDAQHAAQTLHFAAASSGVPCVLVMPPAWP